MATTTTTIRTMKPRQKVLNKKDREALEALARRVVEADPATEAAFVEADKTAENLRAKVMAMLRKNVEELFDPADMAVLAKYGRVSRTTHVRVQLKKEALSAHDAGVSYGGHHWWFGYGSGIDEQDAGPLVPDLGDRHLPWEKREEWRSQFPATDTILLRGADEKLFRSFLDAEESASLRKSDRETSRQALLDAYMALIRGARTYEALLDVWPEASTLRDNIAPANTAVSLLSEDALDLIKKDVARRASATPSADAHAQAGE